MTDRRTEFAHLVEEHRQEWGPRDALRIATLVVFWGWSVTDARFGLAALQGGQLEELDIVAEEQRQLLEDVNRPE